MSKYRRHEYRDEPDVRDGDDFFLGVNMRLSPNELPSGIVSEARNKRFDRGIAYPRRGVRKLPWANKVTNPTTTPVIVPHDIVWGAGVFDDPDDRQWILIAADGFLYAGTEDTIIDKVHLPSGVTIVTDIDIVQAMNDVLIFRGTTVAPLKMSAVGDGVESIAQTANTIDGASTENPVPGTATIPNADSALFIQNRLAIPYSRDLVAVSDFLNYTRYVPIRSEFRINQGTSDVITALAKMDETTIIVLKESSIYRVRQVVGHLTQVVLEEITTAYGCKARESVAMVGKDLWFLADHRGVSSITLTEQGKMQAVDLPVSDAIQPLIDRIKWSSAGKATAAYWNNRYYLAVPLDAAEIVRDNKISGATYTGGTYALTVIKDRTYRYTKNANDTNLVVSGTETLTGSGDFVAASTSVTLNGTAEQSVTASVQPVFKDVNNAILVYNFLNRQWEGSDDGAAIMVKHFFKFNYGGTERLFFLSNDGFINLYEDGFEDHVADQDDALTFVAISDLMRTRGYDFESPLPKHFNRFVLNHATWNPTFTIKAITDGVNESKTLKSAITKSRTSYYKPFDKADYVETNANDDHAIKFREDYSIVMTDGDTAITIGSGLDPELFQEMPDIGRVNAQGRYVQLEFTNTQGGQRIAAASVFARPGFRYSGPHP